MRAIVVKTNDGLGNVEARTDSDLLIVFRCPTGAVLLTDDELEFPSLRLDATVRAVNRTRGQAFEVFLAESDVHDLRLPSAHGSSRTPSPARLNER